MIDIFKRLLSQDPQTPVAESDSRAAIAALLVEAARADDDYAEAEAEQITRILARRYDLDPHAAQSLRSEGEAAQAEAVDLVRFTRAVKDAVPHEDRVEVLEAVWEVIYADGARDHHESALIRKLCGLLHVEDQEAALARQRVAARMDL